jgi:hypothetical protein
VEVKRPPSVIFTGAPVEAPPISGLEELPWPPGCWWREAGEEREPEQEERAGRAAVFPLRWARVAKPGVARAHPRVREARVVRDLGEEPTVSPEFPERGEPGVQAITVEGEGEEDGTGEAVGAETGIRPVTTEAGEAVAPRMPIRREPPTWCMPKGFVPAPGKFRSLIFLPAPRATPRSP